MASFEKMWDYLQSNLEPGTQIRNWTVLKDYFGDDMIIVKVNPNHIDVDPPQAKNLQVVPKKDFGKVWDVWSNYKRRITLRKELAEMTRYSKYIISILRWYEEEN
jgi:hypothetical protein